MKRRSFTLGLITASLSACQTTGMLETGADVAAARASGENSIVFGRIRWIENGVEKPIDQGNLFGWFISPRLRRVEDRKTFNGDIDKGGHFRWALPKGTYVIDKIDYRDPMTGNYFFVPKVAFSVPANGETFYVGTLRADANTKKGFLGSVSGVAKFSVLDHYVEELRYFQRATGASAGKPRKSLMVQDDRLPETFDTTVEWQVGLAILGAL